MTERLKAFLMMEGLEAGCIHGDIRRKSARAVMARFPPRRAADFVATDVASAASTSTTSMRFNYDVPLENGVLRPPHRPCGPRQRRGVAYTLVSDYPSGMRLDGIAGFTGNEVKKAHLDAEES